MTKKLIDDEFYILANKLNPYFYNLGFTPNMLTALSFIFTLLSMTMFYKDYRILAMIFYLVNFYFDCADGIFARTYKMESDYGDFLDHFTDLIGMLLLILILYIKNKNLLIKLIPIAILLIFIIANDHGCSKIEKEKNNIKVLKSKTIDFTKHLCLIKNPIFIYLFNNATVIIFICLVLLFYK